MLAVVFPGQGSQAVGMSCDFAERFPESRDVFERADEALGEPLSRWIAEGPEDRLRRTEITQPAILAASIAVWRAVEPRLPQPPALFAGHSLGEYTAQVAAGGLELDAAIRLVRRRGALMQEAVPEGQGAMAAVLGPSSEDVAAACAAVDGVVAPANFNSPVQTVIAGSSDAVEAAGEEIRTRAVGARLKIMPLEVSAPFHCELMAPARDKLAPSLAEAAFRDLLIPIVSNVTAEPYRTADESRELLRRQVCAPVRWVETVRRMVSDGVRVQLEVGPGNVLTALAARTEKRLGRARVSSVDELDGAVATVVEALA